MSDEIRPPNEEEQFEIAKLLRILNLSGKNPLMKFEMMKGLTDYFDLTGQDLHSIFEFLIDDEKGGMILIQPKADYNIEKVHICSYKVQLVTDVPAYGYSIYDVTNARSPSNRDRFDADYKCRFILDTSFNQQPAK